MSEGEVEPSPAVKKLTTEELRRVGIQVPCFVQALGMIKSIDGRRKLRLFIDPHCVGIPEAAQPAFREFCEALASQWEGFREGE